MFLIFSNSLIKFTSFESEGEREREREKAGEKTRGKGRVKMREISRDRR